MDRFGNPMTLTPCTLAVAHLDHVMFKIQFISQYLSFNIFAHIRPPFYQKYLIIAYISQNARIIVYTPHYINILALQHSFIAQLKNNKNIKKQKKYCPKKERKIYAKITHISLDTSLFCVFYSTKMSNLTIDEMMTPTY